MAENDFTLTKSNISDQGGNFKPGPITALLFVPRDTQIATVAAAMLEATYTTGLNLAMANRWQLIRFDKGERLFGVTPTQDEPKWEESDFGSLRNKGGPGNKRLSMTYANLSPYTQKALASLEGQDLDMFEITENNYIRGKSIAGTLFEGFTVNQFVGAEVSGENSGTSNKFTFYVDYANADENTLLGMHALPTAFNFEDLDGILDCEITEVAAGTTLTTGIVIDLKSHVGNIPITGEVVGDFTVTLVSSGAAETLASAAESTTVAGRYTLIKTAGFTAAPVLIALTAQPDATTPGYETPTAYKLTVTPASP